MDGAEAGLGDLRLSAAAHNLVHGVVHVTGDLIPESGIADRAADLVPGAGHRLVDGARDSAGWAAGEVRPRGVVDLIEGVGRDAGRWRTRRARWGPSAAGVAARRCTAGPRPAAREEAAAVGPARAAAGTTAAGARSAGADRRAGHRSGRHRAGRRRQSGGRRCGRAARLGAYELGPGVAAVAAERHAVEGDVGREREEDDHGAGDQRAGRTGTREVSPQMRGPWSLGLGRGDRRHLVPSVLRWSKGSHASPTLWAIREYASAAGARPLGQVAHRVHGIAVHADLEVQVGAEAEPGAVAVADQLSLADLLAHGHRDGLLVSVAGGDPTPVVDAGVVAVPGLHTGDRDGACRGGVDRSAAGHPDVDAGVACLPGTRLAEGGGDWAVHRPDHSGGALALDGARRRGRGAG